MEILIFFICLIAATAGSICGIGGGVLIKPALDWFGIMDVTTASFLCGLSVLAMAATNVLRQRKQHEIEVRTSTLLAAGAVIGGLLGNQLFQLVKLYTGRDTLVGAVQSLALAVITLLTLLYSAVLRKRLPSFQVKACIPCIGIGVAMGSFSSFLGIGGGPINLAILYFAFSMQAKKAASNSLFIILFSQLSSFLMSCAARTVPDIPWSYLAVMVSAGIVGGLVGSRISRSITGKTTERLFAGLLCVIALIALGNAWKFLNV